MVICNVAKILELVVPLMEHPSETFLATIEEDLMKLIIKYGMTVNNSLSHTRIYVNTVMFSLWKLIISLLLFCVCRWCSTVSAVLELLSIKLLTTTSLSGLASTDSMVSYTSNLLYKLKYPFIGIKYLPNTTYTILILHIYCSLSVN